MRRHRLDGRPVTEIAVAFAISRQAFFTAYAAFSARGIPGLLPGRCGPQRARKCTDGILDLVERCRAEHETPANAHLADTVRQRFGVRIHPRLLTRALARGHATRPEGVVDSGALGTLVRDPVRRATRPRRRPERGTPTWPRRRPPAVPPGAARRRPAGAPRRRPPGAHGGPAQRRATPPGSERAVRAALADDKVARGAHPGSAARKQRGRRGLASGGRAAPSRARSDHAESELAADRPPSRDGGDRAQAGRIGFSSSTGSRSGKAGRYFSVLSCVSEDGVVVGSGRSASDT